MTADSLLPALSFLPLFANELLWITAIGIAFFGLDDLIFDAVWLVRCAGRSKGLPLPEPGGEDRFAIFIPAWDEAHVIGRMLQRLVTTLSHENYLVFVGVYPNDPETEAAVRAVPDTRIVVVQTASPGPTTKADCLNALWDALLRKERQEGWRARAVVLHDAEDVLHPYELTLFQRALTHLHMVQVPVLPLPDSGSRFVSGHYLDEFAESHAKDMVVREAIGAPVPSAGVGTAIDRGVLEQVAARGGRAFDPDSLTEDYELGHKIHALGYRSGIVRYRHGGELVATREYFPATFDAAIRQKGRWLAGIALSGWDRIGWPRGRAQRWMLWRDRRMLLSAFIAILGYVVVVLVVGHEVMRRFVLREAGLPPLLNPSPFLVGLLYFNAFLLSWRLFMRFCFTRQAYGWKEAFLSLPRASVANVINFAASLRAFGRYRDLVERKQPLVWEKTSHRFPWEEADVKHV